MANISLTVETALSKLHLENETNVGAFKCSKFSQDGIIVISNTMINFAFLAGEEGELKTEQFNYPLIQSVFIPQHDDNSPDVTLEGVPHKKYIEIKYGPLQVRFNFYQMQDFIKAGTMLQTILPEKIKNQDTPDPVAKKKVIKVPSMREKKIDSSESVLETDSNTKINILPNTARVSERFLKVASNTVMNYQEVNLKSKEDSEDRQQNLNNRNNVSKNIIKGKLSEKKNEKPSEVTTASTENAYPKTVIRKDDLVNTLNNRNDINKIHQHAKVSDKFLRVASDNMTRSEPIVPKASSRPRSFNPKAIIINLLYLFLIYIFFQTPFAKPIKNWMYKFYKHPDKIYYIMNVVNIERCEFEITSIGKIILVPFKTNNSLPPDIPNYVNKSFPDGHSKDHSKDPWGTSYIFEKQSKGFRIISSGPDKKKGTKDDIVKVFNFDYDPSKLN